MLPLPVRTAEILSKESGIESRIAVWQWYWINGRLTTSDIEAKWLTALSRLRGQGDDSAVVMLLRARRKFDGEVERLCQRLPVPQIQQLLVATREAR